MKDKPAFESYMRAGDMTPQQYACVEHCIPETGIPEVDDVLRKAQRRNLAAMTLQGLHANEAVTKRMTRIDISEHAVIVVDALLQALEGEE